MQLTLTQSASSLPLARLPPPSTLPGATDEADTVVGADNITLDLTRNQAKLAAIHPWGPSRKGACENQTPTG